MAPWVLFNVAQDHPPKTRLRRFLWACAVFAFCGGVLPFAVLGAVEQWGAGDVPGALLMTLLAAMLVMGAAAAVYAFVGIARQRRAERRD